MHSPPLPEDLVFYLDENLCNARAILETLARAGVRFERHLAHFQRGTADEKWLPFVGSRNWVLLTGDKNIRYNLLEKRALRTYAVREFVFASGNMSGWDMAVALERSLPRIYKFCRHRKGAFVAMITRGGEVHLRWPKE